MKPNDQLGKFTAPGELRFVRTLPGPIERVWAYLTDSEKRGRWLAAGLMELHPGGSMQLTFRHSQITPHQEEIPAKYKECCAEGGPGNHLAGRILRCEPPRLLSHTWGESNGTESEVTYELTPQGNEVLLVLTHRKLGYNRNELLSVSAGWHAHLAILVANLAASPVPPFWSTHIQFETEYEKQLPPPPTT